MLFVATVIGCRRRTTTKRYAAVPTAAAVYWL